MTVRGMETIRRQLRSIPPAVAAEVSAQLEKEATKIVAEMKIVAPKKTGALRDSIGWRPGGPMNLATAKGRSGGVYGRLAVTIFAGFAKTTSRQQYKATGPRAGDRKRLGSFDASNARYQEFGTSRMPANPFFFPVWRANKARVQANLKAAVRRAVKKLRS